MANSIKMEIELDGKDALKTIQGISKGLEGTSRTANKATKQASIFGDVFKAQIGSIVALNFGQLITDQFTEAFNSFVQFEKGLINTAKTANLTEKEVNELAKGIDDLTKVIPASANELLEISASAGQLGVKGVKNLTLFSETIAKLGRVSNLSGEIASTTLTRILNVTGEGIDTIDEFASGIVALGNNFAATESEIALVTNEVARASAQFGVSAGEASALSAVLRSFGVRAEEAGTVVGKTFRAIQTSIESGGSALRQLEKITGASGETLRKEFGENSIKVLQRFLEGTKRLNQEGAILSQEFIKIGLTGERVQKVIPTLSSNVDELSRAIKIYNEGSKDATALNEEFARGLESTESQSKLLGNAIDRLRRGIGEGLAGAFNTVSPLVTEFISRLSETGIETFARTTDDVKALKDELARLNEDLKIIQQGGALADGLGAEEIERDIQLIQDKLNQLDTTSVTDQIKNIQSEIRSLQSAGTESSPILDTIYGTPEERQARLALLQEQLANVRQMKAMHDGELLAQQEETNQAQVEKQVQQFEILRELRAQEDEYNRELKLMQDEQKAMDDEIDLQRLQSALGKETALKEVARIKEMKSEKKQKEALRKLREKARKQEQAGVISYTKWENLNRQQRLQNLQGTLGTISTLTSSSNSALFNIGKASALAQHGLNVPKAISTALASAPPPFNFALAGLVGVAMTAQGIKIATAKPPSAGSFAEGGLITGPSQVNDRLTAQVNAGETILNRRQTDTVFRAIEDGNLGGAGNNVTINNPILLNQEGVDMVIDQINDAIEFRNKELRVSNDG